MSLYTYLCGLRSKPTVAQWQPTLPEPWYDDARLWEEELSDFTEKAMGMKYCKLLNSLPAYGTFVDFTRADTF